MNGSGGQDDGFMRGAARGLRLLLQPGIGIKRWIAVAGIGLVLLALGITLALSVPVSSLLLDIGRTITLRNQLSPIWRGLIGVVIGGGVFAFAVYQLYRLMLLGAAYGPGGQRTGALQGLSSYRTRHRGPRVVVIGGGTGLSTLLRGLKGYTENITAIVTAADDGGSSGRLRAELGIAPPGDARQCLVALSESEPLMEQLFSYRFEAGAGLQGHSMGNLLLAALARQRGGSLHAALEAAAGLLAVKGRVVPSTINTDVVLHARTASGKELVGESAVGHAHERIQDLWIQPEDVVLNPAVGVALGEADAVVIGPGSLYTSILPNFLIGGLREAVGRCKAPRILVCNIATQYGETDSLTAADHLSEFQRITGVTVTHFLVNNRLVDIGPEHHQRPLAWGQLAGFGGHVVLRDLVDPALPSRHDPQKLASAVLAIARHPGTK